MLRLLMKMILLFMTLCCCDAASVGDDMFVAPETLFRRSMSEWQQHHSTRHNNSYNWQPWNRFAQELDQLVVAIQREEQDTGEQEESNNNNNSNNNKLVLPRPLEVIGAYEEGILAMERVIHQEGLGEDVFRDQVLARLYVGYARLLSRLSADDCRALALDPHTLLIGVERTATTTTQNEEPVPATTTTTLLCLENAENSARNAAALDATNQEAQTLLRTLLGDDDIGTVHERKPKEFVAELFDSFADSFDEKVRTCVKCVCVCMCCVTLLLLPCDVFHEDVAWTFIAQACGYSSLVALSSPSFLRPLFVHGTLVQLVQGLAYKVPQLVGDLARKMLLSSGTFYTNVLDAGCGTGLAGRYLRPLIMNNNTRTTSSISGGAMIGVDASRKMLDKAALCTRSSGCGLNVDDDTSKQEDNKETDSRPLYDNLLDMDLEDMTMANTLGTGVSAAASDSEGFDLVVAADVLVYFGNLDNILRVFASVSQPGAILIFSTEKPASDDEAPLGWRLLPSGRFAHTKQHAVDAAAKHGYKLESYEEIVPRMEKGEPVRGQLLAFRLDGVDAEVDTESRDEL